MSRSSYAKAYKLVRGYEGGNVNNPKDPGGRTSRGVTQRVYDAYRAKNGKGQLNVYKMTEAECASIYKKQYWDVCLCDDLPAGVDLVVYDTCVNSGAKRAMKLLQASLNRITNAQLRVDGSPGMVTVQAAEAAADHDLVIAEFGKKRQAFYQSLNTYGTFGSGWTKRNRNVTTIAEAWATGSIGPKPAVQPMGLTGAVTNTSYMSAKAYDEGRPGDIQGGATLTTAGAVSGGGLEGVQNWLSQQSDTLQQFSYAISWLQYVLFGIAVIGIGLTVWAYWRNRRNNRINDAVDSVEIPT